MRIALADVGHRHAARRLPSRVEEDAAVHLLVLDVDPFAVEPDLGAVVGGAVEALGEGAVHVGRLDGAQSFASIGDGAVVVDGVQDVFEPSAGRGPDLDAGRKLGSSCRWPIRISLIRSCRRASGSRRAPWAAAASR